MTNNNDQWINELKRGLEELEKRLRAFEEEYFNWLIEKKEEEFESELDILIESKNLNLSESKWKVEEYLKNRMRDLEEEKNKSKWKLLRRKNGSKIITKYFRDLLPKISDKELESFCKKKIEIIEYKNKKESAESKIKIFEGILNSQIELENEEIRELKERLKEESLQREIEITEGAISLLEERKSDKLLNWLKREVNSSRERIIIRKTKKYLEAKKTYLDIRIEIAKKLEEYCKDQSENNTNYQERKIIIKGISDLLGTLTLSIKPMGVGFNIYPHKLAEVVSDINDYWEITSQFEDDKEFKKYLQSDKTDSFKEVYESLKKALNENENKKLQIRNDVVSSLKLEADVSLKVLKKFETRYEKICSIASNWEKEYSDLNAMRSKVDSIIKTLSELDGELKGEINLFEEISKNSWIQQINDLKWNLGVATEKLNEKEEWEAKLNSKKTITEIEEYAKEILRNVYQIAQRKTPSDLWKLETKIEIPPKTL